MIEVVKTYDFLPDIDKEAFAQYGRRAVGAILKSPGAIEVRSWRGLLGSPQARLTILWETLADWARFAESPDRRAVEDELLQFATNIHIELFAPSPTMPEPVRRAK